MSRTDYQEQLPESSRKDLRVLLVDDHEDMLSMMQLLMIQRSYNVVTASCATEALEKALAFAPHIVVSDITMPDIDGYEMMSMLRSKGEHWSFKAIALSGLDADEDLARARAAGFDAHFTKPVDFEQLFEMIDRMAGA